MAENIESIFIVEDDALIAMLLEEMLGELGYSVSGKAACVDEALTLADSLAFDAAILDVSLAGESSYPVARFLDRKGTPYLFATGYGSVPAGAAGIGLPALTKPYQLNELEAALMALATANNQRT